MVLEREETNEVSPVIVLAYCLERVSRLQLIVWSLGVWGAHGILNFQTEL